MKYLKILPSETDYQSYINGGGGLRNTPCGIG